MKTKREQAFLEAVRNAATGYTVVILTIACFIVFLMVVMAVVRFAVGTSLAANTATTAATAPVSVIAAPPTTAHAAAFSVFDLVASTPVSRP